MTPAHRTVPRLRLVAGALALLTPIAPALAGTRIAHLVVGCYALGVVAFLGVWMERTRRAAAAGVDEHADGLAAQVLRFTALLEAGRAVNSFGRGLPQFLRVLVRIAAAE